MAAFSFSSEEFRGDEESDVALESEQEVSDAALESEQVCGNERTGEPT